MRSRSATTEADAGAGRALPETVLVGRLLRPHGVRGELKVEIHSDIPDRFAPGSELLLIAGQQPRRTVRIVRFRPVGAGGLVVLEGCETREDAELLRGARLEIERSRVPAAPEGVYYHYEIVGCRCHDEAHGDLGEVTDMVEDGGGYLLRLTHGRREILVPFVEAFLVSVDIEAGRIDLRLPPGLVEICASGS